MKNNFLRDLTTLDKTVIVVYCTTLIAFVIATLQLIWYAAITWLKKKRTKSL
jgi:hypothetical protein